MEKKKVAGGVLKIWYPGNQNQCFPLHRDGEKNEGESGITVKTIPP